MLHFIYLQLARERYTVFVVEPQGDVAPPETIADDLAEVSLASLRSEELDSDAVNENEDKELQRAIRESLTKTNADTSPSCPVPARRRTRRERSSSDDDMGNTHGLSLPSEYTADQYIQPPFSGRRSQRKFGKLEPFGTSMEIRNSNTSRHPRNSSSPPSTFQDEDLSFHSFHTHSSPFLHPVASLPMQDVDDDALELSDTGTADGNQQVDSIDIEDEQMQAVIAASLGQKYSISQRVLDETQRALKLRSIDNAKDTAQVPEDVERIRRLRESATEGSDSERERVEPTLVKKNTSFPETTDEEAEDKHVNPSPEEMRRLRLARFG